MNVARPRAVMHATVEQFVAAMEFADHSQRSLAEEVAAILRRQRGKVEMGCSHTTILNLATGKANRVHPRRGAAIEKALKLPPGHLFRLEMSHVPKEHETHALITANSPSEVP
jgi:hypothetical protein